MSILSVTSLTHTLILRLFESLSMIWSNMRLSITVQVCGENLLFKALISRLWHPFFFFVCFIFVIASPTFSQAPPPELEALVGSHLSLSCVAHGNPSPTIIWLKDGKVIEGTSSRVGFYTCTHFYIFIPTQSQHSIQRYFSIVNSRQIRVSVYFQIVCLYLFITYLTNHKEQNFMVK